MAKLLTPNNQATEIIPINDQTFTLEELQEYVGGYIEILYLHHNQVLVVNEEGRLRKLPYNQQASDMYSNNYICGNAVWCNTDQLE